MTEYNTAWLDLISTRDDFYFMILLLVGGAIIWYKFGPLHHKFAYVYQFTAEALAVGLVVVGCVLL